MSRAAAISIRASIVTIALLLFGAAAAACPTCYGASDGPVVDGMNMAILAMLGITGVVLGGVAAFFLRMRRRVKRFSQLSVSQTVVNEKGTVQWNNF